MNNEDITYGGIIPLIGGMLWGAEKVLNKKPAIILSYDAFWPNDKLYVNHHITEEDDSFLGKYWKLYDNIEDNHLDFNKKQIDIMCALCPCAGLSQLNCSKTRGSEAPQNDWLYRSTEYTLSIVKPKVLLGENAPALYDGKHGIVVQERLKAIGEKYGYSMTIVKTNSLLHGIPQNRKRSFYYFWQSKTCPILNYSDTEKVSLINYLNNATFDKSTDICHENLTDMYEYKFLLYKFGKDWRNAIGNSSNKSLIKLIIETQNLDEYIVYLKSNNINEKYINKIRHVSNKLSQNLNFRDWTPYVTFEYTATLTGAGNKVIHPIEDRLLSYKELMYIMGLPNDMSIPSIKDIGKLFQNVPTNTAAYWINEAIEFIKGNRNLSNKSFLKQNNLKQIIE